MNLDAYNGMDDATRGVVDQLGKEYADAYNDELEKTIREVRAGWTAKGVEVIPFPKEELISVINDERIQAVRKEWIARAEAAGVPAAEIVSELEFKE